MADLRSLASNPDSLINNRPFRRIILLRLRFRRSAVKKKEKKAFSDQVLVCKRASVVVVKWLARSSKVLGLIPAASVPFHEKLSNFFVMNQYIERKNRKIHFRIESVVFEVLVSFSQSPVEFKKISFCSEVVC